MDVEGKQKRKGQIMSNWPGRKKKKKLKTEKKKIHAKPVNIEKKIEEKREKKN